MSSGDWTSTGRTAGGEPIDFKAEWLKRVTDSAVAFQRTQQNFSSGLRQARIPDGIVRVRNDSGDDRDRFDVLGISGVAIEVADNATSFLNDWMLTGVVPTIADHTGKFVIAAGPIPQNQIGWAYLFGACPVQVAAAATAGDQFDVTDSDSGKLTKTTGGLVTALWGGDDANGNHWAIVRFGGGGGGAVSVQIGASIGSGSTGIYSGTLMTGSPNGSSGTAITGFGDGASVTVYNGPEIAKPAPTNPYIGGTPIVPGILTAGKDPTSGYPIVIVSVVSIGCNYNGSGGS